MDGGFDSDLEDQGEWSNPSARDPEPEPEKHTTPAKAPPSVLSFFKPKDTSTSGQSLGTSTTAKSKVHPFFQKRAPSQNASSKPSNADVKPDTAEAAPKRPVSEFFLNRQERQRLHQERAEQKLKLETEKHKVDSRTFFNKREINPLFSQNYKPEAASGNSDDEECGPAELSFSGLSQDPRVARWQIWGAAYANQEHPHKMASPPQWLQPMFPPTGPSALGWCPPKEVVPLAALRSVVPPSGPSGPRPTASVPSQHPFPYTMEARDSQEEHCGKFLCGYSTAALSPMHMAVYDSVQQEVEKACRKVLSRKPHLEKRVAYNRPLIALAPFQLQKAQASLYLRQAEVKQQLQSALELFQLLQRSPVFGTEAHKALVKSRSRTLPSLVDGVKVVGSLASFTVETPRLFRQYRSHVKALVAQGHGMSEGSSEAEEVSHQSQKLWYRKYSPTRSEYVCGNKDSVLILKDWLTKWRAVLTPEDGGRVGIRKKKGSVPQLVDATAATVSDDEEWQDWERECMENFQRMGFSSEQPASVKAPASTGAAESLPAAGQRRVSPSSYVGSSDSDFEDFLEDSDDGGRRKKKRLKKRKALLSSAAPSGPWNVMVLYGPVGSGKSAAVAAVAEELGYAVVELDPSMLRSRRQLLNTIGELTTTRRIQTAPTQPTLFSQAKPKPAPQQPPRGAEGSKPATSTLKAGKGGILGMLGQKALPPTEPSSKRQRVLSVPPTKPGDTQGATEFEVVPEHSKDGGSIRLRKSNKTSLTPSVVPVPKTEGSMEKKTTKLTMGATPPSQKERISLLVFDSADIVFPPDSTLPSALSELAMKTKCPILLTCNSAPIVMFQRPEVHELLLLLQSICIAESLDIPPRILLRLALSCDCDIRFSIIQLQHLATRCASAHNQPGVVHLMKEQIERSMLDYCSIVELLLEAEKKSKSKTMTTPSKANSVDLTSPSPKPASFGVTPSKSNDPVVDLTHSPAMSSPTASIPTQTSKPIPTLNENPVMSPVRNLMQDIERSGSQDSPSSEEVDTPSTRRSGRLVSKRIAKQKKEEEEKEIEAEEFKRKEEERLRELDALSREREKRKAELAQKKKDEEMAMHRAQAKALKAKVEAGPQHVIIPYPSTLAFPRSSDLEGQDDRMNTPSDFSALSVLCGVEGSEAVGCSPLHAVYLSGWGTIGTGSDGGEGPLLVEVASISPSFGATRGGTRLVIKGKGFGGPGRGEASEGNLGLTVLFGTSPGSNIEVINDDTLQVDSPPCTVPDGEVVHVRIFRRDVKRGSLDTSPPFASQFCYVDEQEGELETEDKEQEHDDDEEFVADGSGSESVNPDVSQPGSKQGDAGAEVTSPQGLSAEGATNALRSEALDQVSHHAPLEVLLHMCDCADTLCDLDLLDAHPVIGSFGPLTDEPWVQGCRKPAALGLHTPAGPCQPPSNPSSLHFRQPLAVPLSSLIMPSNEQVNSAAAFVTAAASTKYVDVSTPECLPHPHCPLQPSVARPLDFASNDIGAGTGARRPASDGQQEKGTATELDGKSIVCGYDEDVDTWTASVTQCVSDHHFHGLLHAVQQAMLQLACSNLLADWAVRGPLPDTQDLTWVIDCTAWFFRHLSRERNYKFTGLQAAARKCILSSSVMGANGFSWQEVDTYAALRFLNHCTFDPSASHVSRKRRSRRLTQPTVEKYLHSFNLVPFEEQSLAWHRTKEWVVPRTPTRPEPPGAWRQGGSENSKAVGTPNKEAIWSVQV